MKFQIHPYMVLCNRISYDALNRQNIVASPPEGASMFADFLQVLELA